MSDIKLLDRGTFIGGLTTSAVLAAAPVARAATLPHVRIGSVTVDSYGQPYYGDAAESSRRRASTSKCFR